MFDFQFAKFLVAGGLAAAGNFSSRFLFSKYVDYEYAIVFAYLVGMFIAFILMNGRVFSGSKASLLNQVLKFSLVNVLAVFQTLVISLLLAYWLLPVMGITDYVEAIAHFVGVLVPVISSYYAHKYFTFK